MGKFSLFKENEHIRLAVSQVDAAVKKWMVGFFIWQGVRRQHLSKGASFGAYRAMQRRATQPGEKGRNVFPSM